jgi:hypothetical protein
MFSRPWFFNNLACGTPFALRTKGCGRKDIMKAKLLVMMMLVAGSAFAGTHFAIGVGVGLLGYWAPPPRVVTYYAPPPVVAYAPPPCPGPGYAWVGGYWYPAGPRYYWHAGYWARPPYLGAYWAGPRYYGHHYNPGYWRRGYRR